MRQYYFSRLLAVGVVVVAFAASADAQKNSSVPVTTTLADVGTTSYPLRVQSDRKGAYVTQVVKRTPQVDSELIVNRNGTDWSLTTYYGPGFTATNRTVFFDLREQLTPGAFVTPLIGTADGVPVEYGWSSAHLIAKCSVAGIDMRTMAPGTSVLCPGSLRFRALNGEWYRFSFQPDNFPTSQRFLVTCTQADSTGCRVWTIGPSGTALTGDDPNPKSRNTLLHIDQGSAILAVGGDYYVSFGFTVAR